MTTQNFRVRNGLTIDGTTSGSSSFASTATGTDLTYVLPGSQGASSTVLTNDGSGNLTWALPGGGGSTFGNITVAVVDDNTISTTTGDLKLDSTTGVVKTVGDLTIGGNDIKASDGTTALSLTPSTGSVSVAGDLFVVGNEIFSSGGNRNLTFSGTDVITEADLIVNGNDIKGLGGTTAITLSGADVAVAGDLAVNGATSADITTTTTTASVFNTTATTVNISGAATTTNIGKNTGSSIINGVNRFTSPTTFGFAGGATSPSRGYMQSNGNTSSFASVRNNIVIRTFPTATATSARGGLIFENSRGNETTPVALATNDLIGELSATGYATNGWVGDYVTAQPGVSYFSPTETWANSGGPYPTAGTVTNAGTGYIVGLQPTATNVTAANGSRINVLNINPQTFAQRSDAFTWANGKTGTTQTMALDVSGNLTTTGNLRVNGNSIKASDGNTNITLTSNTLTTFAGATTTNGTAVIQMPFDSNLTVDARSILLDTNTAAGSYGQYTTRYKPSSGSATYTLPKSGDSLGNFRFVGDDTTAGTGFVLASQVITQATENWANGTANGTAIKFFANKAGQSWTTGHTAVIAASPETVNISSDAITLESSAGTDYLVLNSTSATFSQPVQFPNKTAAQWNAITGSVGMQVCVNDSPVNAGKMAYWDTTNARWSYVDTNLAI